MTKMPDTPHALLLQARICETVKALHSQGDASIMQCQSCNVGHVV